LLYPYPVLLTLSSSSEFGFVSFCILWNSLSFGISSSLEGLI
jgi:hypothetical protein